MATKKKATEEVIDWDNYGAEESGFENVQQSDLGIPFIYIVQKGSAEIDEDHEDHAIKKIDGVKVGCIVNAVTREIVYTPEGPPLVLVPYYYQTAYVEWKPRNQGGGVVQTHMDPNILTQCTRDKETRRDVLPNGNIIVTTKYIFCKRVRDEDPERDEMCIIAFTSTQLKKASAWLKLARTFKNPETDVIRPFFHRKYLVCTDSETNEKGTWRGWRIEAGDVINNLPRIQMIQSDLKQVRREAIALIGTSADSDSVSESTDIL